jgi:formiminotetrahydrofolate cyclodeaminase
MTAKETSAERPVHDAASREGSLLDRVASELLGLFAAGRPTPGAGSAAALLGALAGSLAQTVARHTIRAAKKDEACAAFRERAEALLGEARHRFERLCGAVDADSAAFDRYSRYQRQIEKQIGKLLGGETDPAGATAESRAGQQARAEEAFRLATDVPLGIAADCIAVAEIGLELLERGHRPARGEASTAVLTAVAGGEAAVHVGRLNLRQARTSAWTETSRRRVDELRGQLRTLREHFEARIDSDEGSPPARR